MTKEIGLIVGVCREDNPHDVDEAYGEGTYARLFPPLKRFQLRKNCEYVIDIEAATEEQAWANVPDNSQWEHSWSKTEIEEIEEE